MVDVVTDREFIVPHDKAGQTLGVLAARSTLLEQGRHLAGGNKNY